MSNLYNLFHKYNKTIARIAGQPVTVKRPNYSVVNNTPATITSIKLKVEKATAVGLAMPRFTNAEYYAIFGDRTKFLPGDIIFPTDPNSSTPPVTVIHYSPLEECIGVRTSRIGKITEAIDDTVYENVYFDWIGVGYPGSSYGEQLAGSLGIPTKKALLYTRTNIQPHSNPDEIQGMRLIETDGTVEVRWRVKLVDQIGPLTQFTVEPDR